jgi:peptidoglycan hydrolase CwlO-like protein
MKKFTAMSVVVAIFLSASILMGCDTKTKQENATLKAQVEQLTKDKADLQKTIDDLTNQINTLKAENEQLKSQIAGAATPAPGVESTPTPTPEGMEMPQ